MRIHAICTEEEFKKTLQPNIEKEITKNNKKIIQGVKKLIQIEGVKTFYDDPEKYLNLVVTNLIGEETSEEIVNLIINQLNTTDIISHNIPK